MDNEIQEFAIIDCFHGLSHVDHCNENNDPVLIVSTVLNVLEVRISINDINGINVTDVMKMRLVWSYETDGCT